MSNRRAFIAGLGSAAAWPDGSSFIDMHRQVAVYAGRILADTNHIE
jgi:hypothetical protein